MRRSSKLFPLLLAVLALALAPACGSTVDDDNDTPDAANGDTPDAMNGGTPDAMDQSVTSQYVGETCTGQAADCGGLLDGVQYNCLAFTMGAQTGVCGSSCQNNDDCTMGGYTGPGMIGCFFQDQNNNTWCGIACQDQSDCPAGTTCENLGDGSACIAD